MMLYLSIYIKNNRNWIQNKKSKKINRSARLYDKTNFWMELFKLFFMFIYLQV